MTEYTPEKVAELVETANRLALTDRISHEPVAATLTRTVAAFTAVSAEREMWKQEADDAKAYAALMEAERDRLHKAITEALAEAAKGDNRMSDVQRILGAALDKEGNDDE